MFGFFKKDDSGVTLSFPGPITISATAAQTPITVNISAAQPVTVSKIELRLKRKVTQKNITSMGGSVEWEDMGGVSDTQPVSLQPGETKAKQMNFSLHTVNVDSDNMAELAKNPVGNVLLKGASMFVQAEQAAGIAHYEYSLEAKADVQDHGHVKIKQPVTMLLPGQTP